MELWFSDYHTEKVKVSVKVQKQLFGLQTEFQRIQCCRQHLKTGRIHPNQTHRFSEILSEVQIIVFEP